MCVCLCVCVCVCVCVSVCLCVCNPWSKYLQKFTRGAALPPSTKHCRAYSEYAVPLGVIADMHRCPRWPFHLTFEINLLTLALPTQRSQPRLAFAFVSHAHERPAVLSCMALYYNALHCVVCILQRPRDDTCLLNGCLTRGSQSTRIYHRYRRRRHLHHRKSTI